MRRSLGIGAVVGLTTVLGAWAAPPPDLEPRITTETPPRWSLRDREWDRLDYLKGRPRLPEHPRPPPPEYAFWYWAKEKQARERGDPDPWIVRERKLGGYPHPQPGVALGKAYSNGRDPERPAPRPVRRLRHGRSEGAGAAVDPLARARYREPRPGDVYEVHSPWCEGPPRPLCHGEQQPPPPPGSGDRRRRGLVGGGSNLATGLVAVGGAIAGSAEGALGATLAGAGATVLLRIVDDLVGNRDREPRSLPPDVVAVVEGRMPEATRRPEDCESPPPWETPPRDDCGAKKGKGRKKKLPPAVPIDLEGMRSLGEALATRPPDACHQSCVGCHAGPCGSLAGIFPRFPAYHGGVNRIIGLEEQVNLCRTKRQDLPPLRPNSPAMAAVLVYLRDLE